MNNASDANLEAMLAADGQRGFEEHLKGPSIPQGGRALAKSVRALTGTFPTRARATGSSAPGLMLRSSAIDLKARRTFGVGCLTRSKRSLAKRRKPSSSRPGHASQKTRLIREDLDIRAEETGISSASASSSI
jgi:hypothetical protein